MGKLRIAYLFQSAGVRLSESRALQVHMYHLVRGLQRAGHQVTWVVNVPGRRVLRTTDLERARRDDWREEDYADPGWVGARPLLFLESGIRRLQSTLHLPYLALFDSLRMYQACCRSLSDYDLFHERYNLMSIGGALASRRMGIPLVLEVNADMLAECAYLGTPWRGLRAFCARWATRFSFRTARRIICVSNELREHLIHRWQVPRAKIAVLPNAADIAAFVRPTPGQDWQRKLGLNDAPVVLFVGGFYPWHALNLLVESFVQVVQEVSTAKLVLVGDGCTRPQVENKIEQCGITEAVVMAGAVQHEHLPEIISIADIAVAPFEPFGPWKGGSPLKVFEYMAAGKAIVATKTGQIAEVIRHGHNGLLVEPGDAAGFAQVIIRLLKDPVERARLGQNACRQAAERHSWEHYGERLEEIYRQVLRS